MTNNNILPSSHLRKMKPAGVKGSIAVKEVFSSVKATLDGSAFDPSALKGRVLLVTNVASKCGYTKSNYEQLNVLAEKYPELQILAFPCNQFGGQEPGSAEEICEFVTKKFNAKFKLLEKVDVNGPDTSPVWKALKEATETEKIDVKWNFETKFLISKDQQVQRFVKACKAGELINNITNFIPTHS